MFAVLRMSVSLPDENLDFIETDVLQLVVSCFMDGMLSVGYDFRSDSFITRK